MVTMKQKQNDASVWRYQIAEDLACVYSQHTKVLAVGLGGSVAAGCADEFSDVDLSVFWADPPTEAERLALVEQAGGVMWKMSDGQPKEVPFPGDAFHIGGDRRNGFQAGTLHMPVDEVRRILSDVIDRYDITESKQRTASGVLDLVSLHGDEIIENFRRQVKTYPSRLGEAMVAANVGVGRRWVWEMRAAREDYFLYERLCQIEQKVLNMLLGLNRIYHPGFKRIPQTISKMSLTPENLWARLRSVFTSGLVEGVETMCHLIEETWELIDRHMPGIDTDRGRTNYTDRRKTWSERPEWYRSER